MLKIDPQPSSATVQKSPNSINRQLEQRQAFQSKNSSLVYLSYISEFKSQEAHMEYRVVYNSDDS